MTDEQLALILKSLNDGFAIVAAAITKAGEEAAEETVQFPIGEFKSFDWSKIGAVVISEDADGVALIRASNGRLAKRRSNDKFGTEIWFSYSDGKAEDGTPTYHRVIEFREIKAAEPLGRKTEQALSKSSATQKQVGEPAPSGLRELIASEVKAGRTLPKDSAVAAAYALRALCGEEKLPVLVRGLFGKDKFGDLTHPEQGAVWAWLKPSGVGDKARATNAQASTQMAAFIDSLREAATA